VQGLLENLKIFNRKERFFVVGWALDNPNFTLGDKFRQQVEKDVGLVIPSDAFCAMDFHLDWLHGCLWVTKEERATYSMLETGDLNETNEDVDLVIAYEEGNQTHLLLIEAKGVTGWHNAQLLPKAERLGHIFGVQEAPENWPEVVPHWVLASPKESAHIDVSEWPQWMKPKGHPTWLELTLPPGLRKIVRCDETGKKSAQGKYWKVV
jgi:hypothetical protein